MWLRYKAQDIEAVIEELEPKGIQRIELLKLLSTNPPISTHNRSTKHLMQRYSLCLETLRKNRRIRRVQLQNHLAEEAVCPREPEEGGQLIR